MTLRSLAIFHTTLPDDSIEDEVDIVQYGGRNVAEAIGGLLRARGFEVEQPAYLGVKGWDFVARKHGRVFWLQVSLIDEIYLLVEHKTLMFGGLLNALGATDKDLAAFLRLVDADMRADARFTDLLWYPRNLKRIADKTGHFSPVN